MADGWKTKCRVATYSEQILWQVSSFIDAPIHGDEAVHPRLVPHVWVVKAGVQHDDGERQHVARVWEEGGGEETKNTSS